MNIVKDKKIIAYKSGQIRKIAYNLRGLIKDRVMDEWDRLGKKQETIQLGKIKVTSLNGRLFLKRNQYMDIEDEKSVLYETLSNSICMCSGCSQTNRDMYYNASVKSWFCTLCVQKYRDFYYKNKLILNQSGFVGDFNEKFHETFL